MNHLRTITLILFSLLITSTAQSAVIVDVHGTSYEVSIYTGLFSDLESELTNQVWFGNPGLASDFAEAVDDSLGTMYQNGLNIGGPLLAWDTVDVSGLPAARGIWCVSFQPCGTNAGGVIDNFPQTYAKASVVPLPAAAWLFMSGLIAVVIKGREARLTVA